MSEKKLYWKISIPMYGEAGYIASLEDVMAEINGSEGGYSYLLEPVKMSKEELDALPEFNGF